MRKKNQINGTKTCPNCSNELPLESRFCNKCGATVPEIIASQMVVSVEQPKQKKEKPVKPPKPPRKPMNKKVLISIVSSASAVFLIVLFAFLTHFHIICLNHSWVGRNCEYPDHCTYCGKYKTDGKLGTHEWKAATCIEPMKCIQCGEYKDDKLGNHKFFDEAGFKNKTCELCDLRNPY